MTKMPTIDTLFMTRMVAIKTIPFRAAHAYIAHIRAYPPGLHITPPPPHNCYLSTMETLLCPRGGHCGEVRLYRGAMIWDSMPPDLEET